MIVRSKSAITPRSPLGTSSDRLPFRCTPVRRRVNSCCILGNCLLGNSHLMYSAGLIDLRSIRAAAHSPMVGGRGIAVSGVVHGVHGINIGPSGATADLAPALGRAFVSAYRVADVACSTVHGCLLSCFATPSRGLVANLQLRRSLLRVGRAPSLAATFSAAVFKAIAFMAAAFLIVAFSVGGVASAVRQDLPRVSPASGGADTSCSGGLGRSLGRIGSTQAGPHPRQSQYRQLRSWLLLAQLLPC